jgi:hypothetical protein
MSETCILAPLVTVIEKLCKLEISVLQFFNKAYFTSVTTQGRGRADYTRHVRIWENLEIKHRSDFIPYT